MPKTRAKKHPAHRRVLWLTGLAGAGHSTALRILEDLGYQAIDNLPLSLVMPLLSQKEGLQKPVVMAIDSRVWDFNHATFAALARQLRADPAIDFSIISLDCADDVLLKRFTETRRRHPLATDRPVADGIALERALVAPLHEQADLTIDTTDMKPADLREVMESHFRPGHVDAGLFVYVMSFGFKNGLPREADLVFDARFLDNPYWHEKLRPLSGLDKPVQKMIAADAGLKPFLKGIEGLLRPLLPRYDAEGKKYLTIAIGCTGGRHRSVYVASLVHDWVTRKGYAGTLRHRDMAAWEKKHLSPP